MIQESSKLGATNVNTVVKLLKNATGASAVPKSKVVGRWREGGTKRWGAAFGALEGGKHRAFDPRPSWRHRKAPVERETRAVERQRWSSTPTYLPSLERGGGVESREGLTRDARRLTEGHDEDDGLCCCFWSDHSGSSGGWQYMVIEATWILSVRTVYSSIGQPRLIPSPDLGGHRTEE
ncbi:hypothetical protein MUK42_27907 [Musa troglodytarum]|uniref:Uncharacterized protein n=1 Tax=Musa troglodytarum TaxID=320322 RepID=A0A9E7F013_9LILI|nr:hypothetical protein MUK42_27907 [Musa troglodytarum]